MSKNVKTPILFLAASLLWAGLAVSAPTGVRAPVGPERGVVTAHVEESSPGSLDVVLTLTRPFSPNGLGLAVAFDSKRLRFVDASDLFQEGFVGVSAAAEKEAADLDGDPATDRLVRLGWIDPSGHWAARLRDVVIARLRFDASAGGVPSVSVIPLSGEVEHRFAPLRLSDLAFVEAPDVLPRSAAAFRGLVLSGAGGAARETAVAATATASAAATTLPCNPDADGNGRLDALTDGVLIVRYLMGLRDAALVSGATGTGATRTSGALVTSFLANADCLPMLDADANGARDALTDGVLIARWLFGFADQALVNGALGTGATRTAPGAIASYLVYYSNPREPVIQAVLKAGESAQDTFGQVKVKAIDAAATVTVVSGTNDEGGKTFDFQTSAPVTLEVTLPQAGAVSAARTAPSVAALAADESGYYTWGAVTEKWFAGTPYHNRLPETKQRGAVTIPRCVVSQGGARWEARGASRLRSLCAETDTACYKGFDGKGKDAVLFIHGFDQGGQLGDGTESFKDFPGLMHEAGYPAFLFDWNSAARFEDVAADLGVAIVSISSRTGKQVHIVAHSMGGVLARTLLQGLATSDQSRARAMVRTLTTLGTPHSGIADGDSAGKPLCLHDTGLPRGQDPFAKIVGFPVFEGCQQLTCHELGEDMLDDSCEPELYEVDVQEGALAARLAGTIQNLPNAEVLALLGWTIKTTWPAGTVQKADQPNYFNGGDGLITYEGQRFLPSLTVEGSCPAVGLRKTPQALLPAASFGNAKVTEKALGVNDAIPDSLTPFRCQSNVESGGNWTGCADWQAGYGHAEKSKGLAKVLEAAITCATCFRDGYTETQSWIFFRPANPVSGAAIFSATLKVKDGTSSAALAGVTVTLVDSTGYALAQATTGSGGAATLTAPWKASATFQVQLAKTGYQAATATFQTVASAPSSPIDLGTQSMYLSGTGNIAGKVTDATTGLALPSVAYSLRLLSHLEADRTGFTDSSGNYQHQNLASGTYEALFSKSGYNNLRTEFVVAVGGTANGNASLVSSTGPPQITSFTASPTSITTGQSSTLTWASTGGTTASIDNGVGSIATTGTKTVSPGQTTTYTLTVTGVGGTTTTKQVTVTVTGGGGGAEITVALPGLPAGAKPLVLVKISGGPFQMGSPASDTWAGSSERPQHSVILSDYYIGKYEVTQAQWKAVMGTAMPTSCGSYGIGDDYPVYCVSWTDIAGTGGFVAKVKTLTGVSTFRLPTEAEWERAARGGVQTRFSFGEAAACSSSSCSAACADADPYVWWCKNAGGASHPVATKLANQYGLFDMHGGVWEWVQDWYGTYPSAEQTNPTGPATGGSRVFRGGGWSNALGLVRSAYRGGNTPGRRGTIVGFRLSRSQ